ncbi:mediator of RNA polymerase II transcription subunit 10b-like isoform X3 [Primulina eburnea]|uniref:mediator of RNA polymerase II transcription subunit 10b-like isoform X3 n=1 Tax=Primulina eburnea TaxID=1245227 RepID=UPI003C6C945F
MTTFYIGCISDYYHKYRNSQWPISNLANMDSSSQTTASAAAEAGGVSPGGNGAMIHQLDDLSPMQSSAATGVSAAGIHADDPKQNLNQVINSIQKTLGILHQLYLTVSSFNVAAQLPLLQRILIDDGKNPDEFTRNVLNGCIAKNQIAKGKTDAFKGLRRHLLEELDLTFPDEVEAYREIRASSAAESKRLAQLQSVLPNGDVKVKAEN